MIEKYCNFIKLNDNIEIDLIMKYLIFIIIILIIINKQSYVCLIIFILIILNIDISNNNKYLNGEICRNSTVNNPYGNTLITTDEDKLKIDRCNLDDKIIQDNVEYNQYFNASDLLRNKNNNRVYISHKSKYPNNINDYIEYLYKIDNKKCKEDSYDCGKKNSLKFDRYNYF